MILIDNITISPNPVDAGELYAIEVQLHDDIAKRYPYKYPYQYADDGNEVSGNGN